MFTLIRVKREAIKSKSVNKDMRSLMHFAFADEVSIELSVNNCDLLTRKHPGVLVEGAQRVEVEKGPSPCVRANKSKVTPSKAHFASELSLKRAHCALARR
jgi:hypothetical protein